MKSAFAMFLLFFSTFPITSAQTGWQPQPMTYSLLAYVEPEGDIGTATYWVQAQREGHVDTNIYTSYSGTVQANVKVEFRRQFIYTGIQNPPPTLTVILTARVSGQSSYLPAHASSEVLTEYGITLGSATIYQHPYQEPLGAVYPSATTRPWFRAEAFSSVTAPAGWATSHAFGSITN